MVCLDLEDSKYDLVIGDVRGVGCMCLSPDWTPMQG